MNEKNIAIGLSIADSVVYLKSKGIEIKEDQLQRMIYNENVKGRKIGQKIGRMWFISLEELDNFKELRKPGRPKNV